MKSIVLTLCTVGLLLVSCKDDKKVEDTVAEQKKDSSFTVKVKAIVKKDDVFQIFYNEDGTEAFDPNHVITVGVKGSDAEQDIVFTMPEEAVPSGLRFDIGANKELKEVPVKGFEITYFDKSIKGTGKDFMKYFYPNPQVEFDTINNIAKIKPVPADAAYDPIVGSTSALNTELKKFYN